MSGVWRPAQSLVHPRDEWLTPVWSARAFPSWLSSSSLKPTGGFLSMSFVEIHMSRSSDPNFSDSECLQFFLVIDVLNLRERN